MTSKPTIRTLARRNAFGKAVATPADKRSLVMSGFLGLVRLHPARMVYGHGGGHPQGRPHGFTRVSNRHAHHPLRVETQRVVLKSRKGATMALATTEEQHAYALQSLSKQPQGHDQQAQEAIKKVASKGGSHE